MAHVKLFIQAAYNTNWNTLGYLLNAFTSNGPNEKIEQKRLENKNEQRVNNEKIISLVSIIEKIVQS